MRNFVPAIVLSIVIIIVGAILGSAYNYKFRARNTVSVIGSADYNFTADLIVWSANYQRTAVDIKDAYSYIKTDAQQIQSYLSQRGMENKEIVFSSITIEKQFSEVYNTEGRQTGTAFQGYKLTQTVKVESKKIDSVEKISRDITDLLQSGIELNSQEPLYYYTKLSDLKIDLLAKASKDAYTRALTIANNGHCRLGNLKKAVMGIFQITGQHSNEAYTYMGAFNTSSKNKTANVTVRAEYQLMGAGFLSASR